MVLTAVVVLAVVVLAVAVVAVVVAMANAKVRLSYKFLMEKRRLFKNSYFS